MQNCSKRNQRKPNETDQFQFHKENEMYAQTALKPNPLLRNGAYGHVCRDVQKCTRGCSSLRGRNRLPLCCIKLDTATEKANIEEQKANIEKEFTSKTASHVCKLLDAFGFRNIFGRSDIQEIRPNAPLLCGGAFGCQKPVSRSAFVLCKVCHGAVWRI